MCAGGNSAGLPTMALGRVLMLSCMPCLAAGLRANASRGAASDMPSPFMLVSGVSSPEELCLVAGVLPECTKRWHGLCDVHVWQGNRALTGPMWAWRHARQSSLPVMGEICGDFRGMGSFSM